MTLLFICNLLQRWLVDSINAQLDEKKQHIGSFKHKSNNIDAGWLVLELSKFKAEGSFQTILKSGPYFSCASIKTGVLCLQVYDNCVDSHLPFHSFINSNDHVSITHKKI